MQITKIEGENHDDIELSIKSYIAEIKKELFSDREKDESNRDASSQQ